jgi:hypothetical protein
MERREGERLGKKKHPSQTPTTRPPASQKRNVNEEGKGGKGRRSWIAGPLLLKMAACFVEDAARGTKRLSSCSPSTGGGQGEKAAAAAFFRVSQEPALQLHLGDVNLGLRLDDAVAVKQGFAVGNGRGEARVSEGGGGGGGGDSRERRNSEGQGESSPRAPPYVSRDPARGARGPSQGDAPSGR